MSTGKSDFNEIYNQPDPRSYYRTLSQLDYEIPQHGADMFAALLPYCSKHSPPTVLDLCCSYGVGGVLLKTDLQLQDVYAHYRDAVGSGLETDELLRSDAEWLDGHRQPDAPRVIGLDVADNATRYGVNTEAMDEGFVENLEAALPSPDLTKQLDEVDLIATTGGVGYITARTFNGLLDVSDNKPWVAAFCLRAYNYQPIADGLAERGLITEKSPQCYPQRRFADADEQRWAIGETVANNCDPAGLETTGRYFADFYLSRPPAAVEERSLDELLVAPGEDTPGG